MSNAEQEPISEMVESPTPDNTDVIPPGEVAARAHRCWQERGRPEGSPELDWQQAERELRNEKTSA